jgi:hypothetical protein
MSNPTRGEGWCAGDLYFEQDRLSELETITCRTDGDTLSASVGQEYIQQQPFSVDIADVTLSEDCSFF